MYKKLAAALLTLLFAATGLHAQKTPRIAENFDFDWKFLRIALPEPEFEEVTQEPAAPGRSPRTFRRPKERTDVLLPAEAGLEAPDCDDRSWQDVQLPHDWNIGDKFDPLSAGSAASLPEGVGWYRKHFTLPAAMLGKTVTVLFDGIFQKSDVYINGHHLGTHPYGYSSVYYDLTPYLHFGAENVIAVRSSTVGGRPRWYAGGGIYRHVRLLVTDPVHIDVYGTYVTTPRIREDRAEVRVVSTVRNDSSAPGEIRVSHRILDAAGRTVASGGKAAARIRPGETEDIVSSLDLPAPQLWEPDNPCLYTVETTVRNGNRICDVFRTDFGVRSFVFDPDKGFILNGKALKLQGLAIHQDAGGLGAAVPDRSYERRLEILKEYGCNALRMAHNPPSPEVLDLCDRLGFIVIDEALDKWKSGYYEALFDEWWQRDVGDMLLRDRNHPCIVLWSIGNEVTEAWLEDDEGIERARMIQDFVHATEPTRPVCLAAQNNHQVRFAGVTDVIGYNYLEARAISEHRLYPQRRMLITEELPYWSGEEGNIRSYTPENPWNLVKNNDFLAGGFIWSGVDYLGEASHPSKGWPNGLFDICMFEKPRAAYHRAMWSKEPVVRVAVRDSGLDQDFGRDIWQWPATKDDWTYPAEWRGRMMDIETVTNCEEVELYQNGRVMGRHKTADYPNNTILWHLPYGPGSLTAKAYIGGEVVAEHSIFTTRGIAGFRAESDRSQLKADGQDLAHIVITLTDPDGHRVQVEERQVRVSVEGDGRLLALDNGELRVAGDSFARDAVPTQFGRALAIVQAGRHGGSITVTVRIDGLGESQLEIPVR